MNVYYVLGECLSKYFKNIWIIFKKFQPKLIKLKTADFAYLSKIKKISNFPKTQNLGWSGL